MVRCSGVVWGESLTAELGLGERGLGRGES